VLFNFRGDRAIELTRAFEEPEFTGFVRDPWPRVRFAGMMQYDGDLGLPKRFLVEPPLIEGTMGERLADSGRRQLAIAETHKFGHVSYFWNGNRSEPFNPACERYIEVPSDLTPLEQRPWMRCAEVTDALLDAVAAGLDGHGYDLVRLNYANGDMVAHTGDIRATMIAIEAVDLCLARLVEATRTLGGVLLVTADHGNADHMLEGEAGDRKVRTSHSLNPVPLLIYDPREPSGGPALALPDRPGLSHLAATTLELLGFAAPDDYDPSLLAPLAPA